MIKFLIQAGNPRTEQAFESEDETLSDALQTVFPSTTESLILVWCGIYIPLGYKYDLSLMVDDILDMMMAIRDSPSGSRVIYWPSNTFAAIWRLDWAANQITIDAEWNRVVGGTEALLASRTSLALPNMEFLSEWKRPLEIVNNALSFAGYTEKHVKNIAKLQELVATLSNGQLYR